MRVAVTGGLGFIGGHIVNRLLSKGHEVLIVEHPGAIAKKGRTDCRMAGADITDLNSLKAVAAKGFDAVLHLAGQSSGAKSFEVPEVDITLNILGTLNVIKWCRENGIPRLIFASSFTVYGDNPDTEVLREMDICTPKSVYAISKHTCEQLLRVYAVPNGVSWNALRMFNVYGPGQDLKRGDQGMAAIFMNLVKTGDHVPVKGRLDRFRDLVYIDDVVQGWERCLEDASHPNQVYNLGSGVKTTIASLIDTIVVAFGKKGGVKVEEVGTTPGDIMGAYADVGRISKDLGYKTAFDLKRGIEVMAAWAKGQP